MPTMGEVQSELAPKVTDNDLHSEGNERKISLAENSLNLAKGSHKSSTTDDLELIDIESLFDEDTDDRPVLFQEEAWELFA